MFELWRVCLTRDTIEDEFMSKKNVERGIFYEFEWRLAGDKSFWDDLGAALPVRYEYFTLTGYDVRSDKGYCDYTCI